MMIVEDNSFDFIVRDHLRKKFDERPMPTNWQRSDDHLMLDMITYCSRGNKEEAVNNLTATMEIMAGLQRVCKRLAGHPPWMTWADLRAWDFMFEFWKKCFIQNKVLVQKQEPLPPSAYTEVISRDYGRFLQGNNFANVEAFITEAKVVIASLRNDSENFNNIYKELEP